MIQFSKSALFPIQIVIRLKEAFRSIRLSGRMCSNSHNHAVAPIFFFFFLLTRKWLLLSAKTVSTRIVRLPRPTVSLSHTLIRWFIYWQCFHCLHFLPLEDSCFMHRCCFGRQSSLHYPLSSCYVWYAKVTWLCVLHSLSQISAELCNFSCHLFFNSDVRCLIRFIDVVTIQPFPWLILPSGMPCFHRRKRVNSFVSPNEKQMELDGKL